MAYVSSDEFKAALADAGGIGSRTAADLPDPRIAAAIGDAQAEVAGRLAAYQLPPDDEAPPMLAGIVLDIAAYVGTLEFYGSQALEPGDPVALRYARAQKLLDLIAKGNLTVDGLDPVAGDGDSVGGEAAIYQGPGGPVNLADEADMQVHPFGSYYVPGWTYG